MELAVDDSDLGKLTINQSTNVDLSHLLDNIDSVKLTESISFVKQKTCKMERSGGDEQKWICDSCRHVVQMYIKPAYCPYCGRKAI